MRSPFGPRFAILIAYLGEVKGYNAMRRARNVDNTWGKYGGIGGSGRGRNNGCTESGKNEICKEKVREVVDLPGRFEPVIGFTIFVVNRQSSVVDEDLWENRLQLGNV